MSGTAWACPKSRITKSCESFHGQLSPGTGVTALACSRIILIRREHWKMSSPAETPPAKTASLSPDVIDRIGQALGGALAQHWSRLPQELQHDVFEAAVTQGGEAIRQPLAVFLHGKHHRTVNSLHARSLSEPDSLGG